MRGTSPAGVPQKTSTWRKVQYRAKEVAGIRYLLSLIAFLYGITVGSFVNVLIHRIPNGMDIIKGRSMCTECGHKLAFGDLVPLFSYVWLKGRCRYCGSRISAGYPLVELINGLLYVAVLHRFGIGLMALGWFIAMPVLICVAFIDAAHRIIPDRFPVLLALSGVLMVLSGEKPDIFSRVIGIFSVSVPFLLVALVSGGRAMGGGDIKLMAAAGFCLGWEQNLAALFIGALAGSAVSMVQMAKGKVGRGTQVPFGPYLSFGIAVSALAGEMLLEYYFGLLA
jgi:leader peptidase (prepilin peptidase)/N-methyltransferase